MMPVENSACQKYEANAELVNLLSDLETARDLYEKIEEVRKEENENDLNAIRINIKTKFSESEKKDLKKRFNCHWDGDSYTCPLDNKILVETYLEAKNKNFSLDPVHDPFFNLSLKKQSAERLAQRKLIVEKQGLTRLVSLQSVLDDYNAKWKENLKVKDLQEKTADELKSSATKNSKQLDHLDILQKINRSFSEKHAEASMLSQKIKELQTEKETAFENSVQVKIIPGELHNIVNQAEDLLSKNNQGIYQRGGRLVRIVVAKIKPRKGKKRQIALQRTNESLLINEVTSLHLSETLGKLATWVKYDERSGEWKKKDCPEKIAKGLIERQQWDLPVLAGIVQAPTMRPDGSILNVPGYDAETGLFFDSGQTSFPPIPQNPTKEEAKVALDMLLSLLSEFPFENEESKSVTLSAILTGLVRKSLRTAPLHAFTAPKMGTGKSLLADIVSLIVAGKVNCALAHAENEGEEKKRLLAILAEGDPIICFDNIERPFGSAALCSILTQTEYKDRLLGSTRSLSVPTNALILVTGNNLRFIGDISTRIVLCSLDPKCEHPEERNFEIDPYKYIPMNRGELVKAALTILRAYHVAGRPTQKIKPFGRFEEWSELVRSSLIWLGVEDPCKSRKEIENNDPIRLSLGNLLVAWFNVFDNMSVKSRDIVKRAAENEMLHEALLDFAPDGKGGINVRVFGNKLVAFKNRIENGHRLEEMGESQGVKLWRVQKV